MALFCKIFITAYPCFQGTLFGLTQPVDEFILFKIARGAFGTAMHPDTYKELSNLSLIHSKMEQKDITDLKDHVENLTVQSYSRL
ncbi:hypothetical protein M0804_001995 [Polistes exclamans]|nr:hypothetical protein M0804_001995 [Polistes exclamans]